MKKQFGGSKILITGGAGFIGTNLADRLLAAGSDVVIFDNLSREGSKLNLEWLQKKYGTKLSVKIADIRDFEAVKNALTGVQHVFHLAAQVAVTKSLQVPLEDFEINLKGTINLIENIRTIDNKPDLLFTSTNKVFGSLSNIELSRSKTRYKSDDQLIRANGISHSTLEFCSPYGCSKGAADQYILDYSKNFGFNAVVFRMSCIYGPHQYGNEDQGWVAHFLIRALDCIPVTVFGDGCQVRDILFVDDLIDAMILSQQYMHLLTGQAFSIGGGPLNTISILELLDQIQSIHGHTPPIKFASWRSSDQKYYVSDISNFSKLTGWSPKVSVNEGIKMLYSWLKKNKEPLIHCEEPQPVPLSFNNKKI